MTGGQPMPSGDNWIDRSPHDSASVAVNGITLHYLDWGGRGDALLFLAGMGNSAHIFDDLALRFTDRFRVLALTRRGHGQSDRPEVGYDLPALVADIRQFLDVMGVARASLAGHSLAGDELTRFAGLHPERVDRLVYLDAALDRSGRAALDARDPLPPPPPSAEDFASLDSVRNWLRRQFGFWSDAQEADLRATVVTLPDGSVRVGLPRRIGEALVAGMAEFRPEYTKVQAPALGFYAVPYTHPLLAGADDEATRATARAYVDTEWRPWKQAEIARFRRDMANGRVVELPDAHHYCFIDRLDDVAREMRTFLLAPRAR